MLAKKHGDPFISKCEEVIANFEIDPAEEEAFQSVLAEIVAGIIRSSKSKPPSPFWMDCLTKQLATASPSASTYWASCVQYIAKGRSSVDITWLIEIISADLKHLIQQDDGESFRVLANYLRLVQALIVESTDVAQQFTVLMTEEGAHHLA